MPARDSSGEIAVYLKGGGIITLMRSEVTVETDDQGRLSRVEVRPEGATQVLYLDAAEVAAVLATESAKPGFRGMA